MYICCDDGFSGWAHFSHSNVACSQDLQDLDLHVCLVLGVLKSTINGSVLIYPLRSAIQQVAEQHNIDLNTTGESDDDDVKSGDSAAPDIENPADCIGLHGVSLYDIESLCKLMTSNQTNGTLSAMQVLADMVRYRLLCGQTGYIKLHKSALEKLALRCMPVASRSEAGHQATDG